MELTAADIAQLVGGTVRGDASVRISGVNGIREAQPGDLTFVRGERYAKYLETTRASAVLMERAPAECGPTVIEVAHPDLAFAQVLGRFEAAQTAHPTGISPLAFLGEGVHLDGKVAIAAHASVASGVVLEDGVVLYSGVYVGAGARIGAGTVIYPNAIVREGCVIGARCIIHSGAAIGSDGFGFAPLGGRWMKIPQVGRCCPLPAVCSPTIRLPTVLASSTRVDCWRSPKAPSCTIQRPPVAAVSSTQVR